VLNITNQRQHSSTNNNNVGSQLESSMQWNKNLLILYLAEAGTNDNKQHDKKKTVEKRAVWKWKRLYTPRLEMF
jgi:hypothetical protein